MHTPPGARDRRRIGLALLLTGLVLVAGGFFLPWLSISCSANCGDASWPLIRGPVATDGPILSNWWPAWLLVTTFALFTAVQEFRPVERRATLPAALLAGTLLVVQALTFLLLFGFSTFGIPPQPVLTYGLLPGGAVSLLGTLLVAVGGWLRYHSRRIETSGELAQVPTER